MIFVVSRMPQSLDFTGFLVIDGSHCRDAVPKFIIAMYSTRNLCVAIPIFRPSTFNAVYSHLEIRGEIVGFAVR